MKKKFVYIGIVLLVFFLSFGLALAVLSSYITVTGSVTVMTTTTTIPELDHVVFSEVFYDTPGVESDEEWIELYNPTLNPIDLSGLTIDDNANSYILPDGTTIPSRGFLIIARDETAFENLYEFLPDISGLTLSLANTGDVLRLKNGDDEIDMVAWEDYVSEWNLVANEGESIQRYPLNQDTDTASDWISHASPYPGG